MPLDPTKYQALGKLDPDKYRTLSGANVPSEQDSGPTGTVVEAAKPATKPGGKFVQVGRTTQWQADTPVDLENRPDNKTFSVGGLDRLAGAWKDRASKVNLGNFESNPIARGLRSLTGMIPEMALDTASDPAVMAGGLARRALPKPEVKTSPYPTVDRAVKETKPLILKNQPGQPKVSKPQLALPPGRDPYIAGPGGVQRNSLVVNNPQEEARLLGYEPGNPGVPSTRGQGTTLDIAAEKEAARQRALRYTGHEQAGGSSLNIPDRGMPTHPARGDTRLGFTPETGHEMGWPYNVVPLDMRPRSAQVEVRALAGDRHNLPVEKTPKTRFANERAHKNQPITVELPKDPTRALVPGEPILPSAPPKPRKFQPAVPLSEKPPVKTPVTPEDEVASLAAKSGNKEVEDAASILVGKEGRKNSLIGRIYTQLDKISGREGSDLTRMSQRYVHDTRQKLAAWAPDLEDKIRKLKPEEAANMRGFVEGTTPIPNPQVQAAVDSWNKIQNLVGDEATRVGLRLYTSKDKWVPFQKNTGAYYPHIPAETIDADKFLNKLVNDGVPLKEARQIVRRFKSEGEIVTSSQNARRAIKDLGFRNDADVMLAHVHSMARRISQHVNFGPADIAGKGKEGINDLLLQTKDPQLATSLMERIIGREGIKGDKGMTDKLNLARRVMSYMHLKNFTLPNVALGQQSIAQRTPLKVYAKELGKVITDSKYRGKIKESGVAADFNMSLADEVGKMKDIFLIRKGEVANRIVAGAAGRGAAQHWFKALKANRNNTEAVKELEDLVLGKADDILKQESLTEAQLKHASGRMAEMTQGLNVPGNLPYHASDPVHSMGTLGQQLYWVYKKTGYQNTKSVWDSIKANPKKNIPKWLALSGIAGTVVSGTKSGIASIMSGKNEWDSRDDWVEKMVGKEALGKAAETAGVSPETITRIIDIQSQAFMLGLVSDVVTQSAFSNTGVMEYFTGPAGQEASEIANLALHPNLKKVGRKIIKAASPFPASTQLAERLIPKD